MLTLDLESKSRADIHEVGGWNYSLDPSTEPLIISFGMDMDKLTTVDLFKDPSCPPALAEHARSGGLLNAFNTSFEYSMWTNVLTPRYGWPAVPLKQWRDTQATCLASGFPASLEGAAKALRLDVLKDKGGKALINFFSCPITSGKLKGQFRSPTDHPERFAEFMAYCEQDVRTTLGIEEALPPLTGEELEFWLATWRMNYRGIHIDVALIKALEKLTDTSRTLLGDKLSEETDGVITIKDIQNHGKLLRFCNNAGAALTSIDKKSVVEALDTDVSGPARIVLEARQALGKGSTAKLSSTLALADKDSRCRFVYRYHGAATGRDSSWLQTLPRGEKLPVDDLIRAALAGDTEKFLTLAYKKAGDKKIFDPMGAVVTCLRGCFTASPGNTLVQCDWAAVEPRISAWVSGETAILERFRKFDIEGGPDLYQIGAAPFFGMEPEQVKGDFRQFGKVYELLNLYEGGWKTVQRQGKDQYRINIDEDTARLCVDVFRAERSATVANWRNLDTAAHNAIKNPQQVFLCGKAAFCFDGTHLRMRLPSGRKLTYPFATLEPTLTPFGQYRDQVNYWGAKNGQWLKFSMHGGIWHNAIVQGTGACLMRHGAKECDKAGLDIVLRAHDEFIADVPAIDSEKYAATLKRIMLTPPSWAKDLPLNGAGWTNERFAKL